MAPRRRDQNDSPSPSPRPERVQKARKLPKGQGGFRSVSSPAAIPTLPGHQRDNAAITGTRQTRQAVPEKPLVEREVVDLTIDDDSDVTPTTELSADESIPSPISSVCSSEAGEERDGKDQDSREEVEETEKKSEEEGVVGEGEEEEEVLEGLGKEEENSTIDPVDEPPTTPPPKSQRASRDDSPRHIDFNIHQMIRNPFKCTNMSNETKEDDGKAGFVYVFKHGRDEEALMNGDHQIKIGYSVDPKNRQSKIKAVCRRTISHVIDENLVWIRLARIAEKLAKKELEPWKFDSRCVCGTKHTEIFNTTEEHALKVRQRWVSFCAREPWGENGELKPFWMDRLNSRRPVTGDSEHDCDDRRWDDFTTPDEGEEERYYKHASRRRAKRAFISSVPVLLELRGLVISFALATYIWWVYGGTGIFPIAVLVGAAEFVCYLLNHTDESTSREKAKTPLRK